MQTYKDSESLAKKFDDAYPQELAARLRWWSKALGIDRVRLLRMLGMSPSQAGRRKDEDLKEVLKSPDWEAQAQLVEGGLHRLLALFHYDWHALAERIHSPVVETEPVTAVPVVTRTGQANKLSYTPNGGAADLLINRMAQGGPQSLPALLALLAAARTGHRPAGS